MPKIDQHEPDMMEPETIGGFAFKANQQGLECANPHEGPLTHKASLVHLPIKMPFTSTFHAFSVPLVFRNVRDAPRFYSSIRASHVSKLLSALNNASAYTRRSVAGHERPS